MLFMKNYNGRSFNKNFPQVHRQKSGTKLYLQRDLNIILSGGRHPVSEPEELNTGMCWFRSYQKAVCK